MRTSLLAFLLVALSASAQAPLESLLLLTPTSGAAAPTYLVKQDFEGAGYDNGETWTENASPNEDYTTSPAPLAGSQSWQTAAVGGEAYTSFTGQSTCYAYAMFNFSALDNAVEVFEIRDSGGTYVTRIRIFSDGSVRAINFASGTTSAAGTIAINTTYHMWIKYVKGTGANSTSDVWISTTSTKPGSPTISVSGAGSNTDAARVAVMGWNGGNYIWDKIRIDDADIGSAPQ